VSRINRLPFGLQQFLGSANQGDNPSDLLQGVRPTVDMWALFGLDNLSYESVNINTGVVNSGLTITVPDGQVWIPLNMGARITTETIGDEVGCRIDMRRVTATNILDLGSSPILISTIAIEVTSVTHGFPQQIAVGPGTQFGVFANTMNITSPNVDMDMTIQFYRLFI